MSGFEFDLESTFQVLFQLFFCALTFLWPYFFETDNPKNDFEHRFKANIEKLKKINFSGRHSSGAPLAWILGVDRTHKY